MQFDALKSLFPVDRCREMIKLRWDERDAKEDNRNKEKALEDLSQDPNITHFEKREATKFINSFFDKLSPEQRVKLVEDETSLVCELIVASWLEVLRHARRKNKGQPVRLDGRLLPPPELTNYIGVGLYEFMANASHVLSAEQVLELMTLYAANLAPILDAMFANNPNGFNLTEHLFICRDKGGIYLPPKDEK